MPEPRNAQITINIEQSIHDIFQELADVRGSTISTYARKVVVEHLYNEGLLPEGLMLRILAA